MVERVRIGHLPDGTEGVWTSPAGVNVSTVSNPLDGNQLTFNSNWTDIAKVHQSGVADSNASNPKVYWPDLGYKPFIEVRVVEGSLVFDDSFAGIDIGSASESQSDGLRPTSGRSYPGMRTDFRYIYVAYKIPVPSG